MEQEPGGPGGRRGESADAQGRPRRMDLRASADFLLTPHLGVQPVPVEPVVLAPGTVGLILGRASLALQGLIVLPGIVDTQHSGDLQVLSSSPKGVFSITKGDRIAQLLLLPGIEENPGIDTKRLGSSGTDSAYLMISLRDRPKLHLTIQGKKFEGILDTGADKSIISTLWWPKTWPITESSHSLQGLGYQSSPNISSTILRWSAPDGKRGQFIPYVLPLPVNLWGRDVLQDMGFTLSNENSEHLEETPILGSYSPQTRGMMERMGYKGKGLGKSEQGRIEPVSTTQKSHRKGLGFF